MAKFGIKKKVGADTYSVDYIFPFVASASWKHDVITVPPPSSCNRARMPGTNLIEQRHNRVPSHHDPPSHGHLLKLYEQRMQLFIEVR